jgi:hypothetical protein
MAVDLVRTSLPEIEVTPTALDGSQAPNTMVTHTLTINNLGAQPLSWNIQEWGSAAPTALVAPVGNLAVVAESVDTAVENLAGPVVPSGYPTTYVPATPATVLYTNGPYVNMPGGGPSGADGSVLQNATLGMNILGYGHALSTGFRVADEFTVPGPNAWQISSIRFYAYQTGSTISSTINHVNLQIWNGVPGAGSSVVYGDSTTNRLAATGWTGAYRYSETTVGTTRPVMSNTAAISVTLPPGTYWLDWQTGGTLASGPWANPIAITNVLTTGNAIQSNSATWTASTPLTMTATGIDPAIGVPQGLPFVIEGTEVVLAGCGVDIPWASVSPSGGSTPGFGSSNVNVVYDSTGLTPGVYTGTLCVNSNDANNSQVLVPLTLTVVTPSYGVGVTPSSAALSGAASTAVTYTLSLTNTGNVADTYSVTVTGNGWTTSAPATAGPVSAGGTTTLQVVVTIPSNAILGDSDTAMITLTSQGDTNQTASTTLVTSVASNPLYLPIIMR